MIGRPMSANVRATTFGYGPTSPVAYDYFNKAASGASFLTITTAHVLDVVEGVLGNILEVDARTELLWPESELVDGDGTFAREVPDHVDLIAKTALGASVSVQVLAGIETDAHFVLQVRGSKGWLKLVGSHLAGVQVGDLALSASVDCAAPDAPVASGVGLTAADFWKGAAINVGEVYASLARDISVGTIEDLLNVNTRAAVLASQAAIPHLTSGSRIIRRLGRTESSAHGTRPLRQSCRHCGCRDVPGESCRALHDRIRCHGRRGIQRLKAAVAMVASDRHAGE